MLFRSSAVILCSFAEDLCSWEAFSETEVFKWERKTSEELENENVKGPGEGFDHAKNNYFAIASNKEPSEDHKEVFAFFKSPLFNSKEHPTECFTFWFEIGVRPNATRDIILARGS